MIIKEDYSIFARFYDEYMEHVEYDNWIDFLLEQYNQRHSAAASRILELACGTGNIANRLVKRGYDVEATDISGDMLELGREKPFPARFKKADMLSPLLESNYDLILLIFDSINYLQNDEQLSQLFSNVSQGLKRDGLFIFDISTSRNCLENFDGFVNIKDSETSFFVHQSFFDTEQHRQETHLTLFEQKGNLWQRNDEIHIQKIYKPEHLMKLIRISPLYLDGIFTLHDSISHQLNDEEVDAADNIFNRLFFICGMKDA